MIEDKEKSNCTNDPYTENMIIHEDNLLALKALESKYAGQVKCIYIDPPYNTGLAFDHYDDNLEHSTGLSLMKPRLEILRNLLSEDGSIWISIYDDDGNYLSLWLTSSCNMPRREITQYFVFCRRGWKGNRIY